MALVGTCSSNPRIECRGSLPLPVYATVNLGCSRLRVFVKTEAAFAKHQQWPLLIKIPIFPVSVQCLLIHPSNALFQQPFIRDTSLLQFIFSPTYIHRHRALAMELIYMASS